MPMLSVRFICLSFLIAGSAQVLAAQAPVIVNNGPMAGRVTRGADRPRGANSPIPPQLRTARKVFLSNAGSDAGLFPHPFSGTQDRAYGYVYRALQADGRFTLVDTPAEADLVFEIQLSAPEGSVSGNKQQGTEDALPSVRLTVFDRPTHYITHYILWSLAETIYKANLQKTHDKNFDDALDLLLRDLKDISTSE